jgi:hypothetical protein
LDAISAIAGISVYLKLVLTGEVEAMARVNIVEKFSVSVGMLEHGFKKKLGEISDLDGWQKTAASLKVKDRLQFEMNQAASRCGANNSLIDCPHILAELQNIDLNLVMLNCSQN